MARRWAVATTWLEPQPTDNTGMDWQELEDKMKVHPKKGGPTDQEGAR